jgi:cation:H+ antiporter
MPLDLSGLPTAGLLGIFAAAALCVWTAGTRLTRYLNGIAEQTGLGKAFTGMLFLGGITSLPEVAAVSTSAALGNAALAINNLLGAASVNLVLLAVADVIYGRKALTGVAARPVTLMQGVLSMTLAAAVAIFAAAGDIDLGMFGAGAVAVALGAAAALWIASRFEHRHVWDVVDESVSGEPDATEADRARAIEAQAEKGWPFAKLVAATSIAALVILIAGVALSTSADALAERTGIEAAMIGFVLVAASTALPEISSVISAIRLGEHEMAVGDVFGTNLFNLALIFLADWVYAGPPILLAAGTFEIVGSLLAVLITGVFVVGLLQRQSRAIFRMGYDSLAALLLFAIGMAALADIAG